MKLVVGLGNPTKQYAGTRHNVGAMMVDAFIALNNIGKLRYDAKFNAEILKDGDLIYAFPQTFMNLSGNAVESLMRWHKIIPEDLLVIHDEIELPLGKIAIKSGGGAAGHNGLRSIISKLGTNEFQRLRIGIGKSERIGVAERVLQSFSAGDRVILDEKKSEIFDLIEEFRKG